MAKTHGITVSDVTLKSFHVKQAQNEDGEWGAWCVFQGAVIDEDGNEVKQMEHLTRHKVYLAQGSPQAFTKAQIASNKDVIFAAFSSWIDSVREELAGITG